VPSPNYGKAVNTLPNHSKKIKKLKKKKKKEGKNPESKSITYG
jgi:hypothetical protein